MYVCGLKLRFLHAEDTIKDLFREQKSLVTWKQQMTKSSTKEVNPRTITGTLSWYKILSLNGFNLIGVKPKLRKRHRKVYTSFLHRHRSQKLSKTENSLVMSKSCEELTRNHRTSTPHRSATNEITERAVRRVKEGTSAVLLQSGFDEKWWSDSMECFCFLRNVQDILADGKTPYERRFGESFKGLP